MGHEFESRYRLKAGKKEKGQTPSPNVSDWEFALVGLTVRTRRTPPNNMNNPTS
ncbi:MAG: hypothetical protein II402_02095 [Bacteroidaceae bacterium]|nr:hypothetical protein [Bacteroidaceae bacterium]MBQ2341625.1 hypothetical protein [Bacteroidaceae bacterium]MBQ6051454.1 hypothetical protein [Bacteroidaceae bacterium]